MYNRIGVLLVDDHEVVRAGLRQTLNETNELQVVGEVERAEDVVASFQRLRPELVMMDLSLPGIGGLVAIRRLIEREPQARILVFSIHDELAYVSRALDAGARGYVSKTGPLRALLDAAHQVAHGHSYVEPKLAQRLVMERHTGPNSSTTLTSLSQREFEIFGLVTRGLGTRQVAEQLCLSHKTVANHITIIKSKLAVKSTVELVRLAYEHGLIER